MAKKDVFEKLHPNSKKIVNLLEDKSALKQDVYEDSHNAFNELRELVKEELDSLKTCIEDDRIRLSIVEKSQSEFQVFIGSDVLVYQVHSNVFRLDDQHPLWDSDYLKEDQSRGYFGIIHIYNFLAESFLQNRYNDPGYLIGRIFVNKDGHFFVEGRGQLGFLFKDLEKGEWRKNSIVHIIQVSFAYALEFDLFVPPYEMVQELSVGQMQAIGSSSQAATGKRLGFKFSAEDDE
ncbi:MAG TPA: hypothetical protein VKZ44_09665 [Taishania sp.]|nr:hypothetical protein [Taishania sp.]